MASREPPSVAELAQWLAEVLGVEPGMLFERRSFAEQGVGQSALRELSDALQRRLGVQPPDMMRECTTLAQLHEWLLARGQTGADARELHVELGFIEGLPDPLFYE